MQLNYDLLNDAPIDFNQAIQNEIETYTQKANGYLDSIQLSSEKKEQLKHFGDWLMQRTV